MIIIARFEIGRDQLIYKGVVGAALLESIFFEEFSDVGKIVKTDIGNVLMEIAIALDYPLVFCHNLCGQVIAAKAVICKQVARIDKKSWDFHI